MPNEESIAERARLEKWLRLILETANESNVRWEARLYQIKRYAERALEGK